MLPSGTVTFWFTDIVGSTAQWEVDPDAMRADLAEHNAILSRVAEDHQGHVFKTVGDAYCVAFADAEHAAAAALAAQDALARKRLKVRMALHTASIQPTGDDYFGPPVNRVARLTALAHGGQVLMSEATKGLLPPSASVADLGHHVLRDLLEPMRIWQLGAGKFAPIAGVGATPNNLPLQNTTFVGRETEMRQISDLLQRSRLITLTGAGGTGKTRLALQVAAERIAGYPDGAWFCEFAALPDREDVLRALVAAVGVPDSPAGLQARLTTHLAERRVLLVLDNCEHVLDSVAEVAQVLLASCANVTILATSREPIGLSGEIAFRVPSLPVPEAGERLALADLERFGATALLLDRLSLAAPSTQLDESQAGSISRICVRLDGIPLAIELAAARSRAMSLEQIEKRLDDRFRLLTGGKRGALSRQQTLRALVDWSVRLLEPRERRFLCALAVFSGGWALEACEAVCASPELAVEEPEVLDLLTALVDKSLVVYDPTKDRYSMLETIRQYAQETLQDDESAGSIRDRHASKYLDLSGALRRTGRSEDRAEALRQFAADYENFRAAVEWTADRPGGLERAIAALDDAYSAFWSLDRGSEFVRLLGPLLARADSPDAEPVNDELLKSARLSKAVTGTRQEDPGSIAELLAMKASFREMSSQVRSQSASSLAYALFRARRFEEGLEFVGTVIADYSEVKTGRLSPYLFVVQGNCLCALRRFDEALAAYAHGLDALKAVGDERGYVACLANFVIVHVVTGQTEAAIRVALQLNERCTRSRVYPSVRSCVLEAFSASALEHGDLESAATLLGGALEIQDRTGMPPDAVDEMADRAVLDRLEAAVGPADRERWVAAGRKTDWEPWFQRLLDVAADDCRDRVPPLS
ncbi:MAG TPA: adenylate/guanylate cyclase domain-containing protein [Fimbriimonadaceae bacterium]|nr:adenylate/guanylate cyclase domain-containing protein [Fimbriimonadaceae bacterium]